MPSKNIEIKNKVNKEYYHRNIERIREGQRIRSLTDYKDPIKKKKKQQAQRKWRENNVEKYLYGQIKRRCLSKGIPFNLELSDIIIPSSCPILGMQMKAMSGNWDNSPSVDRIDPTKGYTKDNIQIISMRANRIKSDASPKELRLLADFMEKL